MSTFDEASLVFIPSGYKDQKLYSVKPLSGDGDLTFSRASSATRVASNGLIEKVRTNLVLQSQAFNTTANWPTNASPTITANTTVAPDGTTTADTIAATGSFSGVYQSPINVSNGVEHSWSIYIKNISSATNIFVGIASNPSTASLNYNATSGTITSSGAGLTASSATSVGNGWYRLSGTYVSTGTYNDFVIYGMGTMSFAVWGAQLETGVTTAYIATTSAAVSVGPVANVPRLDYLNSTCPRLLLQPQRTNVITNYNDFVTGASNVTTTANNATSPEGYQNADLITGNAGTLTKVVNFNGASAGQYTISVFAKYNTQQWIQLTAGGVATYANFDIQNGVVGGTNGTSTITDYGNGWYRCSLLLASGTPLSFVVGIVTGSSSVRLSTTASTGSFWAYGFQSELGTYATSIIPTNGTSVTRVADAASKTGISSLIGSAAGTIYLEASALANDLSERRIALSDGTTSNVARVGFTTTSNRIIAVLYNGANQCVLVYDGADITQTNKIAFTWSANDFALFVNGVKRSTDISGTTFAANTLTRFGFDRGDGAGDAPFGNFDQVLLFKSRLSDSDLETLTA